MRPGVCPVLSQLESWPHPTPASVTLFCRPRWPPSPPVALPSPPASDYLPQHRDSHQCPHNPPVPLTWNLYVQAGEFLQPPLPPPGLQRNVQQEGEHGHGFTRLRLRRQLRHCLPSASSTPQELALLQAGLAPAAREQRLPDVGDRAPDLHPIANIHIVQPRVPGPWWAVSRTEGSRWAKVALIPPRISKTRYTNGEWRGLSQSP